MHAVEVEKVCLADNNLASAEAVVEIPVLLESRLLTALEEAACVRGTSAGSFVRHIIRDYLHYSDSDG